MACSGCASRRAWLMKWMGIAHERAKRAVASTDGGSSGNAGAVRSDGGHGPGDRAERGSDAPSDGLRLRERGRGA
ncbi:MAG TPA: hypothetical protein DCX91_15125 [Stenotrophomonas sp.]|nr:hypothetical protein [Stenotrophomonas sp.]